MTDYVMAVLVGLTIVFGAILVSIVCDKLTIWRRAYHRERQFLAWREHEIARKELRKTPSTARMKRSWKS
jgi:hypothetical protein